MLVILLGQCHVLNHKDTYLGFGHVILKFVDAGREIYPYNMNHGYHQITFYTYFGTPSRIEMHFRWSYSTIFLLVNPVFQIVCGL
jgi:hypothetical protein